ncbi:hypothetical protein SAMN05421676_1071 [Salinibacillus kushneri]|uniref:Uncharacterized protein n=1 Tax=Salinibacillus kushneri TaxID=237682 RepID=A0A1I0GHV7_9BACI|nr:hypothetical protein SAMN05421676_1071 [Salinibacillus kushneri]
MLIHQCYQNSELTYWLFCSVFKVQSPSLSKRPINYIKLPTGCQ